MQTWMNQWLVSSCCFHTLSCPFACLHELISWWLPSLPLSKLRKRSGSGKRRWLVTLEEELLLGTNPWTHNILELDPPSNFHYVLGGVKAPTNFHPVETCDLRGSTGPFCRELFFLFSSFTSNSFCRDIILDVRPYRIFTASSSWLDLVFF